MKLIGEVEYDEDGNPTGVRIGYSDNSEGESSSSGGNYCCPGGMGIYNAAESESKRTGGDMGDILTRMHNEQFEGNKEVIKEVAIFYAGRSCFKACF